MCRIDYADDGGLWLQPPHKRKARVAHTCGDCGRKIEPGESYHYGVWKGDYISIVKACAHCVAAGRWLQVVCGGHLWPGVIEELEEHWQEEWELRSLGLGRLVLCGKNRWMTPRHVVERRILDAAFKGTDADGNPSFRVGKQEIVWSSQRPVTLDEVERWTQQALDRVPAVAKH